VCPTGGHVHRCHPGSVHSHRQRVPDKVEVDVPQSGLTAQRPEPVAVQLRNEDPSGLLQLKLAAARPDRVDIRQPVTGLRRRSDGLASTMIGACRSPRGHSSEQETHSVQRSHGSAVWARARFRRHSRHMSVSPVGMIVSIARTAAMSSTTLGVKGCLAGY
jgi:hypothetical protein